MNKLSKTERKAAGSLKRAERRMVNIARQSVNRKRYGRLVRMLGPGIVTGAADNDPSGIATYSQAGAAYGTGLLWAFPMMYPLLLAVQESCARIGAVTGRGLAAIIKENYNRKLLYFSVFLVLVANIVNIGADLGAMAATAELLVPLPFGVLAVGFALTAILLEVFVPYKTYARILKWLVITLFAYPITAFLVGQDWGALIAATFTLTPKLNWEMVYIFVGLLGTTISPYLFFWDTSEIVEGEIVTKRLSSASSTPKMTRHFLRSVRLDNFVGMSFASTTAWFIVVVCASVLFSNGINHIETAADAARALEPLVSDFPHSGLVAKIIFSVGVIGVGLLAVPVLAGSASYAISETMGWREGLYRKFSKAIGFYAVIILATLVGLLINFVGIDPMDALVFTAVFNGVAAVPLLWIIARIGSNAEIMGEYRNGALSNLGVRVAFVVMALATVFLFVALGIGKL